MKENKPMFVDGAHCSHCDGEAVAMAFGPPQYERVAWCVNGHVTAGLAGARLKVVYDFKDQADG